MDEQLKAQIGRIQGVRALMLVAAKALETGDFSGPGLLEPDVNVNLCAAKIREDVEQLGHLRVTIQLDDETDETRTTAEDLSEDVRRVLNAEYTKGI